MQELIQTSLYDNNLMIKQIAADSLAAGAVLPKSKRGCLEIYGGSCVLSRALTECGL